MIFTAIVVGLVAAWLYWVIYTAIELDTLAHIGAEDVDAHSWEER